MVETLDMAAGSCNPLGCPGACTLCSAGLRPMPKSESCCSTCPETWLWRAGSERGPGAELLQFEQSNRVGSFSLVEKPLEMAAVEKRSYCQTRKCFLICLLIFGAPFWMVFKPKSNHTRQQLPALLPTLGSCTRGSSRDGKSW